MNYTLKQQLEKICDDAKDYYQNHPEYFTDEKDHHSDTVEGLCQGVDEFKQKAIALIEPTPLARTWIKSMVRGCEEGRLVELVENILAIAGVKILEA